jgi:hypothetical protein
MPRRPTMTSETFTYNDVRYQCPKCRRFVAESAIESTDYIDTFNCYYGVGTSSVTHCAKCGDVEDFAVTVVGTHEMATTAPDSATDPFEAADDIDRRWE